MKFNRTAMLVLMSIVALVAIVLSLYSNIELLNITFSSVELGTTGSNLANHIDDVRIIAVVTSAIAVFLFFWSFNRSLVPVFSLMMGLAMGAGVHFGSKYAVETLPKNLSDQTMNTLMKRQLVIQYAKLSPDQLQEKALVSAFTMPFDVSDELFETLTSGEILDLFALVTPGHEVESIKANLLSRSASLAFAKEAESAAKSGSIDLRPLAASLASTYNSMVSVERSAARVVSQMSGNEFQRAVSLIEAYNGSAHDNEVRRRVIDHLYETTGLSLTSLHRSNFCDGRLDCGMNYTKADFASDLAELYFDQQQMNKPGNFVDFVESSVFSTGKDVQSELLFAGIAAEGSIPLTIIGDVSKPSSSTQGFNYEVLKEEPYRAMNHFLGDDDEGAVRQAIFSITVVPLFIIGLTIVSIVISAFVFIRSSMDLYFHFKGGQVNRLSSIILGAAFTLFLTAGLASTVSFSSTGSVLIDGLNYIIAIESAFI